MNHLCVSTSEANKALALNGWSGRRIARELAVNRKTVARYLGPSKPAIPPPRLCSYSRVKPGHSAPRMACQFGRDGVSPSIPWAARRGGDGPRDSSPTGEVAASLVGTVSHRPFPGLPDEVGMARETRALPGKWQPFGRDGVSLSVPWAAGRGGDGPRDSSPTGEGKNNCR